MAHRNLVVDLNNLVFATRYSKIKTPGRNRRKEEFVTELIFKEMITYIAKFSIENKVDGIMVACDSPHVWRKDIFPSYKSASNHEDVYYDECIRAANLCKDFFRECTNSQILEVPRAEADDIIGVFCNESENVENIIMSSDKDFIQLLSETTSLYSPTQKEWRKSEDPQFDLFVKCIRGDRNDCVPSAFPKVYQTRLEKAWNDPLEMQNLVETVRKDGVKVFDALEMNLNLIDLSCVPEWLKENIRAAIMKPPQKQFGEMKMMSFFGKHNLKKFSDMLTYKERPFRGTSKWKCN